MASAPAHKKLLVNLEHFRVRGFVDMRLIVTDNAQMVLLATEKLSETVSNEHQRIIYTPRNGMSRTASKTHLALHQTLNNWSRQNPGYCKGGSSPVHNAETMVYVVGGLLMLVAFVYALSKAFH